MGKQIDLSPTLTHDALKSAFDEFNKVSHRLAESYQLLGLKVEKLSCELSEKQCDVASDTHHSDISADTINRDLILQALPVAVIIVNGDGVISYVNDEMVRLTGMTALIGERWAKIIDCLFKEEYIGEEMELVNGNLVSVSMCPLGYMPGQIIILKDVTKTRELNRLLIRQKQVMMLADVSAALAHQIRTPISSAMLYASKLMRGEERQYAGKILDSLKRVDGIIREILSMSMGADSAEQIVGLADIVNDLKSMVEAFAESSNCNINIDDCHGSYKVSANRELFVSILTNIINNSIESLNGKSERNIYVKNEVVDMNGTRHVRIFVIDAGVGIDSDVLERVFEPFFSTKKNGSGIGLSIAKASINAWGGAIEIRSEYGLWTEVVITMPVVEE